MKRKIVAIVLLCSIAGVAAALFALRPNTSEPITYAEARQLANQQNLPKCVELHAQNVPAQERADISEVVGRKVTNVPSGTAYAAFFRPQDSQKVNGTIVYDSRPSIAFNFTVERTHESESWKLKAFDACEE
jgi:hypothetical protein